jgi:hypothetical protein
MLGCHTVTAARPASAVHEIGAGLAGLDQLEPARQVGAFDEVDLLCELLLGDEDGWSIAAWSAVIGRRTNSLVRSSAGTGSLRSTADMFASSCGRSWRRRACHAGWR